MQDELENMVIRPAGFAASGVPPMVGVGLGALVSLPLWGLIVLAVLYLF